MRSHGFALGELRDDVRNDSQESLNTMKKPSSHWDTSGSATHETPFDGGTAVHEEAGNIIDDNSVATKSRASSLNGGGSRGEGSGTQGQESVARLK